MNTNPDIEQLGVYNIDFQTLRGREYIALKTSLLESQNQDNKLLRTDLEQSGKKKQSRQHFKITEIQGQSQHSQQYQNFQCALSEHQGPIQLVVLDSNLKHHQRFFCSNCIGNLETKSQTIGFQKAMVITQDIYKKRKEFRDIIFYKDCKELEQLKNNLINLKSFLNNDLDQMIKNTEIWVKDLENYKSQVYNFDNEIDWLIQYQQKVEIEYLVEEIKPLNIKYITKLKKKLEQFCTFTEQYTSCQNILKNLMHEKISYEKEKNKQQCKRYDLRNSNQSRNVTLERNLFFKQD